MYDSDDLAFLYFLAHRKIIQCKISVPSQRGGYKRQVLLD